MKNLILFLALLVFGAFVACEKESRQIEANPAEANQVPDDLVVYETDENGSIVRSENYRLLTQEELEVLAAKGWIELERSEGEIEMRVRYCKWADEEVRYECDGDRCGVVSSPGTDEVCIGCFDGNHLE